jgi:hypothetical protein
MSKVEINSIFIVTLPLSGKQEEVMVSGCSQSAISFLRKKYPRFTKFVLDGFEIDGYLHPIDFKLYNKQL